MWRRPVARFVRDEEVVGSNPAIPTFTREYPKIVGAWRSSVARFNGVEEVAGSNPVAPTKFLPL